MFIVVSLYIVIDSVRKLLDTHSYANGLRTYEHVRDVCKLTETANR